MGEFEFIPPDLKIEILCRLPVRSLLRFTTVCKSWYSLITSPNFITKHHNQAISTQKTPFLMLRRSLLAYPSRTLKLNYLSLHIDNPTFDQFADLPFPQNCQGDYNFRVSGVCNGLLCLSSRTTNRDQIMALWNPSLRKSLDVPEPSIVSAPHPHCVDHPIGFGYDPIRHDYKIVRLTYRKKKLGTSRMPLTPPYVQVFELSTGNWIQVDIGVDFPYVPSNSFGVQSIFLNGFVHWTGYDVRNCSDLIVRFDMRNNKPDVIMGPPSNDPSSRKYLGIFENLLSFLYYDGTHSWCLWVMKQYGIVSSWTKQYNIVLEDDINRVVCFRQNGDILCEKTRLWYLRGRKMLAACNSQGNLIKHLDKSGICGSFCVDTYVESLVLLKSSTKSWRSEEE